MKVIILIIAGVVGVALALLVWSSRMPAGRPPSTPETPTALVGSNAVLAANPAANPIHQLGGMSVLPAWEMAGSDKAELEQEFQKKLKPALDRWAKAYAGHLPFDPADLTLDKFVAHNTIGNTRSYTFKVGDSQVIFIDSPNKEVGTKVTYMNSGSVLKELNTLPTQGTMPDLSMPVNRNQVMQMAKADTGIDYPPEWIRLTPSGASSSLTGGAMVDISPPDIAHIVTLSNIMMTFGPDGKLLNYSH